MSENQMTQALEIMSKAKSSPTSDPTVLDPASAVRMVAPEIPSEKPTGEAPKAEVAIQAEPSSEAAPKAPATPEPPKATPGDFAAKFAALSRREKDLVHREAELKKQAEQLKGKSSIDELKGKAKQNPMEALKEMGLTYEEITQYILEGKVSDTPEKRIQTIDERVAAIERKEKEMQAKEAQAKIDAAVQNFKTDITNFVSKDEEKYSLIRESKAEELVYSTIEKYFEETQRVLDMEEACDLVEKHLESEVEKWTKFRKVQKRFEGAGTQKTAPVAPNPPAVKTETTNTLTNADSIVEKTVRTAPKSRDEEIEEAVKLLRFKK